MAAPRRFLFALILVVFLSGPAWAHSPSGTTIPDAASLIDAGGHTWTLSGGVDYRNGRAEGHASLLLYYEGRVYGYNPSGWWEWTGSAWSITGGDPQPASRSGAAIPGRTELIDSGGNVWTVTGGQIDENGIQVSGGGATVRLLYYNGTIYTEYAINGQDIWWSWNGALWINRGLNGDPRLIAGSCGPANNVASSSAPVSGLCSAGTASSVSGSGPWSWSCAGSQGGSNAQCSAPLKTAAVNGACGPAAQTGTTTAPSTNLCTTGTATAVTGNGAGSFEWDCDGSNGGSGVFCITPAAGVVSGSCGAANGSQVTSAPTANLCSTGTATAVSADGSGWEWDCQGTNGGGTVVCTASPSTVNGSCGAVNGTHPASAPTANLCAAGTAGVVTGGTAGPWTWFCYGSGTGSTDAECQTTSSQAVNGVCGSANGTAVSSAPSTGLCIAGTASSVSGTGPWSWSCAGSNSGTTAQCSAPKPVAVNGQCGTANGVGTAVTPSKNLCSAGTASFPTGNGTTYSWSCAGAGGGTTASCSAPELPVVNGACGSSNGAQLSSAPTTNLCIAGTASAVSGSGPWNWTCAGANLGTTVSCTALVAGPAKVNGTCGPAAQTGTTTAPTTNLCTTGAAGVVTSNGAGSFEWDCDGSNDGSSVFCITPAAGVVSGSCGSANGSRVTSAPTANLCSTGTPTKVAADGSGWEWDCKGANGGDTVVCTASPPTVNGSCGAANGSQVTSAPTANLCAAGTAGVVTGGTAGPWTWFCYGSGTGSTDVLCQTAAPVNGMCGAANGTVVSSAPSTGLCMAGTASSVSGSGPWSWSCAGSGGGSTAQCSALVKAAGGGDLCGTAANVTTNAEPSINLCVSGAEVSSVRGAGPWFWACTNGSSTSMCQDFFPAGATPTGPAFYVATNGSDSNPGTLDQPFATLQRAAQAMENSSTKTTYIRGGTYTNDSGQSTCGHGGDDALTLSASDAGETWSYYPPDGYDSAILDGGGGTRTCGIGGSFGNAMMNLTINGLTLQNFEFAGLLFYGGTNILVENNIVHDIPGSPTQGPFTAAIQFECAGNSNWGNLTISHNYIYNVFQNGTRMDNGAAESYPCGTNAPNNTTISYNYIDNVCTGDGDCGGIYYEDDQGTGNVIAYNYVKDVDPNQVVDPVTGTGYNPLCVYYDGYDYNIAVKGNVCTGTFMIAFGPNGISNDVYQYNIVDLESVNNRGGNVIFWDNFAGGNQFINNIIVSNSSNGGSGYYDAASPNTISDNLYYGYGSATPNDSGDSSPVTGQNPQFSTSDWTYTLLPGSPAFNAPVSFPQQPANDLGIPWGQPGFWGPPGFVIPETGTTPSYLQ